MSAVPGRFESVFGWRFDPWGPPGFYQIKNAGQGLLGALQERRELVAGVRVAAYETSMGVDDLRATMAAVEAGGGASSCSPTGLRAWAN
jgi:predicted enzyme related to lactoylglutathione lyase